MKYRADIDGLRAVAVLPVMLYHAGFAVMGGGFVGVDIFFVISGYLITQVIAEEIRRGDFSLLTFYERRIRRIFPALFAVMAFAAAGASLLFVSQEFKAFGHSVVAATGFVSNVLFWTEADYFDTAAEMKPLLHTWSLSVEEQFYVVFPLFLVVLQRWLKWPWVPCIAAAAAASFALSLWPGFDRSSVFYLAPPRAWELLLGSLLAVRAFPPIRHQAAREAAALAGMGLIAYAVFFFTESTEFPRASALLPCVGAALVIYAGEGGSSRVAALLATRPMVGIGLISYSLYLWHWPLLVFARYWKLDELTPVEAAAIVALTVAVAAASWKFIEQPFRRRGPAARPVRQRLRLFAGAGAAMASAGAIGLAIAGSHGWIGLLWRPADDSAYRMVSYDDREPMIFRADGCFLSSSRKADAFDQSVCLARQPGKTNYLLMGDSHAAHWWVGLSEALAGANVMQATVAGCRPLLRHVTVPSANCRWMNGFIFEHVAKTRPDGIILAGRWVPEDLPRLAATLDHLRAFTREIIVIGPVVEYRAFLPYFLVRDASLTQAHLGDGFLRADRPALDHELRRVAEAHGARYLSEIDMACPGGRCDLYAGKGIPMQFDYGHLTPEGARLLAGRWRAKGLLPGPVQVSEGGGAQP